METLEVTKKSDTLTDVQIHKSKDYDKFSFLKGNRFVNEKKVEKIIRAIKGQGLDFLKYCPVIVDTKLRIIDGQHRFHVSRELNRPVYYVVAPLTDIKGVALLNSNTDNWKMNDYLDCYIRLGVETYAELKRYIQAYSLPIGAATQLLQGGSISAGGGARDSFKSGDFQINHLEKAREIGKMLNDYREHMEASMDRNLIVAACRLHASEKYDHQQFMDRIQHYDQKIEKKDSPRHYISHLTDLFNFHRSHTKHLV